MLKPVPLFPGRGCARRSADLLRRSDFSDVEEVPEEFTDNQLRDAHNDIVRRLRPERVVAAALAALAALPLFGGLVVETHAKGDWPNTSNVVTSVSWEGGTGTDTNSVMGIVDASFSGGTNAVNDAVRAVGSMSNSWSRAGRDATNYVDAATNAIRRVDGAARPLPKYLHVYDADDSYPDAAQEYYRSRGNGRTDGGCSSVRDGGFLFRNFDYPLDERAEFVVKMSAGPDRFASVGVAQVGTDLTEQMVTSGKPEYSRLYKWLPGATVDGINENGVACNINVVDGDPQTSGWHNDTGDLHPLAAIRWALDHATNAQHAATYIASHIAFPQGWKQNFHYMIADEEKTYIVENGEFESASSGDGEIPPVMTNFPLFSGGSSEGAGQERYQILTDKTSITNVWYTNAYRPDTTPPWISDFGGDWDALALATNYWARAPKEVHRGESFNGTNWWQTVHTSVYDLTNRVLRVSVQETDDWYVFQVPSAGGTDETKVREIASEVVAPVAYQVSSLQSSKADKSTTYTKAEINGFLDEKVTLNAEESQDGWIDVVGDIRSSGGSGFFYGSVEASTGDVMTYVRGGQSDYLSAKANRADSSGEVLDGELATLDEDGNPTRSGKTVDDFLPFDGGEARSTKFTLDYGSGGGLFIYKEMLGKYGFLMIGEPYSRWHYLRNNADYDERSPTEVANLGDITAAISATDPTFKSEVLKVSPTNDPVFTVGYTDGLVVTDATNGQYIAKLIPNLDGSGRSAIARVGPNGWTELLIPNDAHTVEIATRTASSLAAAFLDAGTNTNAVASCECICTNLVALIRSSPCFSNAVEKVVAPMLSRPPRWFDSVQGVWYEAAVVNGVMTLTVSEEQ